MKKILLSIIVLALFVLSPNKAKADACGITNTQFTIRSVTFSGGACTYVFDIGWDQANNNGNKWSFVHLWETANYPSFTYASPPTGTQLNSSNSFGTLVIEHTNATTSVLRTLATAYPNGTPPYPNILSGTLTRTAIAGGLRFLITGVTVTFSSCPVTLSVKGDVWSSQANTGQVVHCFNNNLSFIPDPVTFNMTAILFCNNYDANGRKYNVQMTSQNTFANKLSVYYEVYVDNGNGSFLPSEETLAYTSSTFDLYTGNPFNNGQATYLPYSQQAGLANKDLWILATVVSSSGGFNQLIQLPNGCIGLPVDFKSFSATRNKSNVILKWTTSTEKNNSGFVIERNVNNANWEEVTFIRSQALAGNSNLDLDYQYNDNNNTKGISQYRIKQVDIDSRFKYTEVRSVKGDGQIGEIIVYPNPSTDGRINVVFDNATVVRNILVTDMSGRTIKQINSVSNNNITIDNLMPGMYSLRVLVPETGEQTVKKIVVNKR